MDLVPNPARRPARAPVVRRRGRRFRRHGGRRGSFAATGRRCCATSRSTRSYWPAPTTRCRRRRSAGSCRTSRSRSPISSTSGIRGLPGRHPLRAPHGEDADRRQRERRQPGRAAPTSATSTASSVVTARPDAAPGPQVPPQAPAQRPADRQRGLHLPRRLRSRDEAEPAARLRLPGADRRLADAAADDQVPATDRDARRQRRRQLRLVPPDLPGDPPGDAVHLRDDRRADRLAQLGGELRTQPR